MAIVGKLGPVPVVTNMDGTGVYIMIFATCHSKYSIVFLDAKLIRYWGYMLKMSICLRRTGYQMVNLKIAFVDPVRQGESIKYKLSNLDCRN